MKHCCLTNNLPLLCVIPYALPDKEQAYELLTWIAELGGSKRHDCLLVCSAKVDLFVRDYMLGLAAQSFKQVWQISTPGPLPDERWPIGPNWMFQTAMNWVQREGILNPFWWNEPDCIWLCEGALDFIEDEYYRAGKPFMGCIVKGVTVGNTDIPDSLNGCAVYPHDTASRFGKIQFGSTEAWDILAGPITVPNAHHSKHYQYFWGEPGLAPTFRARHEKGEPKNVFTLEQLRPDAVMFHRNKDSTLIPLLRARRKGATKIIHVVECHEPMDDRTRRAMQSWEALQSDQWETVQVWRYPRDSQQIGDNRALPMLLDLLHIGLKKCQRDNDIVCLTNGDNLLHVTLPQALEHYMTDVPALCSFRVNICDAMPRMNVDPGVLARMGKPDFGRDLFAFRKWWLEENLALIPDMFLGEWEWDLILALMIRRGNGVPVNEKSELNYGDAKSELPLGYVLHEVHERKWMSQKYIKAPAKWHNQRVAKEWYKAQGMEKFYTLI